MRSGLSTQSRAPLLTLAQLSTRGVQLAKQVVTNTLRRRSLLSERLPCLHKITMQGLNALLSGPE